MTLFYGRGHAFLNLIEGALENSVRRWSVATSDLNVNVDFAAKINRRDVKVYSRIYLRAGKLI